jgi:NTE family protein
LSRWFFKAAARSAPIRRARSGRSRRGYCPKGLAGISIGAINVVIICGNHLEKRVERLRAFWERVISRTPLPFNLDGFLGPIFANASANPLATVGAPGF